MEKIIQLPINQADIDKLNIGDFVYLEGILYTARDASHSKMVELLNNNKPLPFEIKGQSIYYMGPSPTPTHLPCGSAGPTTSSRMDVYTPRLLEEGLRVMIGKGDRSQLVADSIKKNHAVYFGTIGGAGAYLGQCIKKMECIAFDELGAEAVYKLHIEKFPAIVLLK
ncbi:MAG: fumarate hydratase [Candidatus Margulisbacteria bacterium GWF2_35_9]|nr:MAG: fumarate hydratase [Candidatus Margulisbacteria bacterium GWF2_35_9]